MENNASIFLKITLTFLLQAFFTNCAPIFNFENKLYQDLLATYNHNVPPFNPYPNGTIGPTQLDIQLEIYGVSEVDLM